MPCNPRLPTTTRSAPAEHERVHRVIVLDGQGDTGGERGQARLERVDVHLLAAPSAQRVERRARSVGDLGRGAYGGGGLLGTVVADDHGAWKRAVLAG